MKKQIFKTLHVIDSATTTIAEHPALVYVSTFTVEALNVTQEQFALIDRPEGGPATGYVLTFTCASAEYPEYVDTFATMAHSFGNPREAGMIRRTQPLLARLPVGRRCRRLVNGGGRRQHVLVRPRSARRRRRRRPDGYGERSAARSLRAGRAYRALPFGSGKPPRAPGLRGSRADLPPGPDRRRVDHPCVASTKACCLWPWWSF